MLPFDRWSPRRKAGLAVGLALLLWIPQGISVETQPLVTGHSTFFNGDVYDQCLASVAGILRSRVLWFNDQVLVERYPGKGTFVYVTEHGGLDPADGERLLFSDGVTYTFVDPNGAAWHVEELYLDLSGTFTTPGGSEKPSEVIARYEDLPESGLQKQRQYVWVVELAATPIVDQFPGDDPHSLYNFLVLVDTCKMNRTDESVGGTANHNDTAILNDRYGHPNNETAHAHEVWNADIYVGQRPLVLPGGVDHQNATRYESEWAMSAEGQQNAASAGPNGASQAQAQADRRTAPNG
jgi:hypothetical protein